MGSFKNWLINEDIAHDQEATGDLFHPTSAGDYMYAASDPGEHWWLQWRWDQERKQGRKFYNIDQQEFEKRNYTTIQSNDMPKAGEGGWKHKPGDQPSVSIKNDVQFVARGVAKNARSENILSGKTMVGICFDLDRIFGDKTSGKWSVAAIDKKWSK